MSDKCERCGFHDAKAMHTCRPMAKRGSDSAPGAGSVPNIQSAWDEGVWVKSKITGQFYAPTQIPESDIEFVVINGTMFHHIF